MLNTNAYTATLLENNMYKIETVLNDEPISFTVIVAQGESEIDELVQFRLNELTNPPTAQETAPAVDLQSVVQQLKNELDTVKAELQNLKE